MIRLEPHKPKTNTMKKFLLPIAVLILGGSISISSCKKEEESTDIVVSYASITGMAYANTNETNDTLANGASSMQYELVPSGTTIIAVVNPQDYTSNPDAQVNYENISYQATVGADGSYSFDTIAAYANSVNVTINYADFAYNTIDYTVDNTGAQVKSSTRHVYVKADENITLVANDARVVDVNYAY